MTANPRVILFFSPLKYKLTGNYVHYQQVYHHKLCASPSRCVYTYSMIVTNTAVFSHFRRIAKSKNELNHVCLSVRPHGTLASTRLTLTEFDVGGVFENTSRIFKSY